MRILPAFMLVLQGGLSIAAPAVSPVTTVRALHEAVVERRIGVPFDITVTVTQPCRFKSLYNITCVEDETDGLDIKDLVSRDGHDPAAGAVVRYRGKTELVAGVTVYPTATEMTVLGKGAPPVARPVGAVEFHSGKFDRRLVEVEGCISEVIRDEIDAKWCYACIRCPPDIIHVAWPLPMLSDVKPIPKLSMRQMEILDSITRGLTDQDIARELGISVPMVKEHLATLREKLGASNRTEAVAIALRKHLLKI